MYYNDYEDYMRSVLGYDNANDCTYGCNYRNVSTSNIEQMYPEIYKIINPVVCRMCDNNTQPISEYMIEQMTDDIYDNVVNRVEIENVINLNIGTTREIDANNEGNSTSRNNVSKSANSTTNSKVNEKEDRETRSPQPRRRNALLRDLIRILIINRLIRRRPNRPPFRPRPGFSGMPPRPPMPRVEEYMPNDYFPYM